jgi:hypothetical protein
MGSRTGPRSGSSAPPMTPSIASSPSRKTRSTRTAWGYFGTTQPGDVFEFVIRLDETDPGPYRYETLCNGRRVRQGIMPVLDNQVDVSHETWTHGVVSGGDYVMAVEGWVNYPPRHARWYAPDLDIRFYSNDPRHKTVSLDRPPAYKFSSAT